MSLTVYLPPGRKAFYHATYIYDRILVLLFCCVNGRGCRCHRMPSCPVKLRSGEDLARLDNSPADLGTFRQAWANECPWIKIVSSEALFTGCAACNYLHRLLETTPRSEVEQAHAIRLRLGLAPACCSHPVMYYVMLVLILFSFRKVNTLHSKPHSAWRLHALKNFVEGLAENLGDSSLHY